MARFLIECALAYQVARPTTLVLNILPAATARQRILSETVDSSAVRPVETAVMPGTDHRMTRITAPAGRLEITARIEVEINPLLQPADTVAEVPVADLPFPALAHLPPSRYVPADQFIRLAQDLFGQHAPGFGRVAAISAWINAHLAYQRGASNALTTAADTFIMRAGVCRDFAHLGVAFCRALGIPARYVNAYAWRLDPEEHHAVFEAFLDGSWWLLDPTGLAAPEGLIRIGAGRDAADVPIGTIHGEATPEHVTVRVAAVDPPKSIAGQALSLAD